MAKTKIPSRITATFDALEIGFNANARMLTTGAFYNARKHPQFWAYSVELTSPLPDGTLDKQRAYMRTDKRITVSQLCEDIRLEVRTMGENTFVSCMVYAEVVNPQHALGLYAKFVKRNDKLSMAELITLMSKVPEVSHAVTT